MMHADRTNRMALILLALICMAAGVGGLLANTGVFSDSLKHEHLFDNFISRYIGRHGPWLWAGAAVVCALLLLLCLRWLLALLISTDRSGDLTVAGDRRNGATTIRSGAITDAITTEIASYHSVDTATARLVGDNQDPTLVVRVAVAQSADVAALRQRLDAEALTHARHALGKPELPIQVDFDVSKHVPERVR